MIRYVFLHSIFLLISIIICCTETKTDEVTIEDALEFFNDNSTHKMNSNNQNTEIHYDSNNSRESDFYNKLNFIYDRGFTEKRIKCKFIWRIYPEPYTALQKDTLKYEDDSQVNNLSTTFNEIEACNNKIIMECHGDADTRFLSICDNVNNSLYIPHSGKLFDSTTSFPFSVWDYRYNEEVNSLIVNGSI